MSRPQTRQQKSRPAPDILRKRPNRCAAARRPATPRALLREGASALDSASRTLRRRRSRDGLGASLCGVVAGPSGALPQCLFHRNKGVQERNCWHTFTLDEGTKGSRDQGKAEERARKPLTHSGTPLSPLPLTL